MVEKVQGTCCDIVGLLDQPQQQPPDFMKEKTLFVQVRFSMAYKEFLSDTLPLILYRIRLGINERLWFIHNY